MIAPTRHPFRHDSKLSVNQVERRVEADRAQEYWESATSTGLHGDQRNQWVYGQAELGPENR